MLTAGEVNEILKRREWSAQELADACFVSRATVYNWLKRGCSTAGMGRRLRDLLENARKRDNCASVAKG